MNESAYRFGEFLLIPARRELWRSDRLVMVQPKVFGTLTYLLQHRDRVIGTDELALAVWRRNNVTDNVLGQIVGRARRAVSDSGEAQHSIRTIPRVGYHWIRDVEVLPADAAHPTVERSVSAMAFDQTESPPTSRVPPQLSSMRRWSVSATMLALLGTVTLAGGVFTLRLAANSQAANADTAVADVSTLPVAERIQKLREALASDQLDLARTIFGTFSDQDRTQPMVRYDVAELALKEGRFDDALRAFNGLLADLGNDGPPMVVGSSLCGAGLTELRLKHFESAQQYFERAIPVLTNVGPDAQTMLGLAWLSLGTTYTSREKFNDADHAYAQAREILQGTSDFGGLAKLESSVGVSLIGRYRYADALERFQRATALAAQTKDANAEARARMNLVNAQLVLLHPAAALESEPRLRELRDRIGDPVLAAHADIVRAKALIANGRLSDAALALQAGETRPTAADKTLTGMRRVVSAELAFAQGALESGVRDVRSVLALPSDTFGDDGVAAYARWRLLDASQAQGNTQGVIDAVTATDALRQMRPNEPTVNVYAALAHAELADAQGDSARARSEFDRALAQVEATHIPFDLVRVVASYTQFLLRRGDVEEASGVADHIREWSDKDYSAALVQLQVARATGDAAWNAALIRARRLAGERIIPAALIPASTPEIHRTGATELASVHTP